MGENPFPYVDGGICRTLNCVLVGQLIFYIIVR